MILSSDSRPRHESLTRQTRWTRQEEETTRFQDTEQSTTVLGFYAVSLGAYPWIQTVEARPTPPWLSRYEAPSRGPRGLPWLSRNEVPCRGAEAIQDPRVVSLLLKIREYRVLRVVLDLWVSVVFTVWNKTTPGIFVPRFRRRNRLDNHTLLSVVHPEASPKVV